MNDDVAKGNDPRVFGDLRRDFGVVFCKAGKRLADNPELALDCGAQKFIGTVLFKALSRAEGRNVVRGQLLCRRDISALQAA